MQLFIVSGVSGAGKSTVISILEDSGYFCVDNLPPELIPKFAELCQMGSGEHQRAAVVCDIRGGSHFDGLFQALDGLKAMKCGYRIVFMEASDPVIIRRYKETRRNHPLAEECGSLEEAIAALESDQLILDTLGDHVAANYLEGKKKEGEEYRTRVSSWEREKYIINY